METATATTSDTSRNFKSFHLHHKIEAGIAAAAYSEPTPIQARCIPSIIQGRDMIGLAHTGTGKTAAFVLPILQRLLDGPRRHTRALIIAPTRELADQTQETISQLGCRTGVKSAVVYGGVNKGPQIRQLGQGAEIVVACPGRLLDLMNHGEIDVSKVEVLVIDEADRMFDMGFLPDIRRIVGRLPRRRQTLLFSATMPDDIRRLVQEILQDPVNIQVGDSTPVSTVAHAIYPVEQHLKTALLMRLLERTDTKSVLVFTRTKHRATRLATQIARAGFIAASLQGALPQTKRQAVLSGYRNGKYQILVATDIAARGIDIANISHVINYDMPDTVDAYTHRIGRTGRAARTGDAFSFVTREERGFVWSIEKALGETVEKRTLADFNYNVPVPLRNEDDKRSNRSNGSNSAGGGNDGYAGSREGDRSGSRHHPSRRSAQRRSFMSAQGQAMLKQLGR